MNKKGFTLIELLAVIVILAVIALIATPVIMNAIGSAKQGAWKDAAYGIIKATENAFAKGFSETTEPIDTFFLYENGVMTSYPAGKTIDYKGSVPQDGGIVLHADGSITLAIHDGVNCAVKTKTTGTVTLTTTDKATCISNVYYKQASAPFNNALTNGDFSQGTIGWSASYGVLTTANNIGTFNSIGNYSDPLIAQVPFAYQANAKLYVKYTARALNSDTNSIYFSTRVTGISDQILNLKSIPVANTWYTDSALLTLPSGGSGNVSAFFRTAYSLGAGTVPAWVDNTAYALNSEVSYGGYAYICIAPHTSSTAGGLVPTNFTYWRYKKSYNKATDYKELILFNLTSIYGTGNEPTKEQMDNNLNKVWIDSSTNTPKRFTAGGWVNF